MKLYEVGDNSYNEIITTVTSREEAEYALAEYLLSNRYHAVKSDCYIHEYEYKGDKHE